MKKQLLTIRMLLVVAMLCLGVNVTWAEDGIKRSLSANDYSSGVSDWMGNFSSSVVSGSTGQPAKYISNSHSNSGPRGGYKSVSMNYTAGTGYTTSNLAAGGYNIEFNFAYSAKTNSGSGKHQGQFMLSTGTPSGNSYESDEATNLFSITYPEVANSSLPTNFYINDLASSTGSTLAYSTYANVWLHVKLVVTSGNVNYTITKYSDGSAVASGNKTTTGLLVPKRFFACLGRGSDNLKFSNLDIYDYVEDFTIPAPTFSSGRVDGANRTYTLTNTYGAETLYYTTSPAAEAPAIGNAAYTSTALVSKEVSFSQVGKYYAYVLHSNGTKASDIAEVEVATVGEVTLATPVFTIEDFVLAEDGHYYPKVSFKSDNSGKEGAPTATLSETSPYTFTSFGSITVTASADGYTSSSNTFTVNSYYKLSKTIDFGALTASDFDDNVWTSGTGVPRDYWTSRAAAIPANVPNRKLTNTSSTAGDPDNSAVVDGITISNYYQRSPEFCIGYGMYTPYTPLSGSSNNMNLTVNGATATDYAVYNGWNNYGNGTFNTVKAGNATFGLFRYDTMLRTIKLYSPISEVATLSLDKTSATVEAGEEVSFTATIASGSPAPTLQWYSCDDVQKANAAAIDGETAAIYSPSTTATGTYYLFVRASNSAGNKDSEVITLNITGTVATPTYTIASYNYEQGGYAITPACETEGATLTYKVGNGDAQSCAVGEPFYAKDGKLVITASKEGWTSSSTPTDQQFILNAAPSSTSPETLIAFQTSNDDIEKNITHTYKSVTIAGGNSGAIAGRDGNGRLKLRTNQGGNTITLNVNSGYRVTGVTLNANTNSSSSDKNVVMTGVKVDGGDNILTDNISLPLSNAQAYSYSTGTISANNSIVFSFDNSNGITQIMASIVVTYMTPTEAEVADAIADCKTYETSTDFATYIDGGTYASAAEVYAAHSAWQIAQAKANGSTDYSKAILNRTFELHNTNGWTIYGDARSDADTDKNKYGEIEYGDDWSQYYTGYNGRNVSQYIASLPAGTYRLAAYVYSWGDNNTGATVKLFANGSLSENQGGTNEFSTTFDFAVTGNEESIKIGIGGVGQGSGDNTWGTWGYRVKNFTLTKISESMTISSVGWATYCSPYNLDFSETGATVYTAARNTTTNNISLSEVSGGKVPANTGVILYKNGGGEITPSVIASANAVENNELVGIIANTTVTYNPSDNVYNYIMEWDSENSKPKFSKAAANGATLRANKAYLSTAYDVETGGPARALSVSSDAVETTGINNVHGSGVKAQGYYNLNGQRVSQPTKGLYIVNGRKVVVK